MNEKKAVIIITVILLLAGAGGTGYFLAKRTPPAAVTPRAAGKHPGHEHEKEKGKKQLWTCGMHPWIVEEEPGQCPICGMDLVPKTDSGGKDAQSGITIDPETVQNMGLRTAVAKRTRLVRTIRTWGHVTYDETRTYEVSPKVRGWIEEARVDFTGSPVKKGEVLARIYSPAILTAEEEYLAAGGSLKEAARRRLLYWDVPEWFIRRLDETGRPERSVPLVSPRSGVVTRMNAAAGAAVRPGAVLYEISDLSRVWVEAHLFEYELPWIKTGQEAVMTLPYIPGARFTGKVSYLYPYLEKKERNLVARLEFANPDLALRPEMYADIEIRSDSGREGVVVPSEAVLKSGTADTVFIAAGNGRFIPRKVKTGLAVAGGMVEIIEGVSAGEAVVVSGQFLLDSESRLEEATAKMLAPAKEEPAAGPQDGEDDFFSDM